jgi:hypothetical protein
LQLRQEGPLAYEAELNRLFRQQGAEHLGNGSLVSDYIVARHHGMPTRLVDWTMNALVALYVACASREHLRHDGWMFLLDPFFPRRGSAGGPGGQAAKEHGPLHEDDARVRQTISSFFGEGEASIREVFPLIPRWSSPRIVQQASMFTVHPPGAAPLDPHFVSVLRIPAEGKVPLLHELSFLGVNGFSLFRDLEHLAGELQQEWVIDAADSGSPTWLYPGSNA